MGMDLFRFICILTFVASMVNGNMQDCSLGGIDIQHCLDTGKTPFSPSSCCVNLNQAVQAGSHCLCSLLDLSNPLLVTKISLLMTNCYISMPPRCRDSLTQLHPPGIPVAPKANDVLMNSSPDNSSIVNSLPSLSSNLVPKSSILERFGCISAHAADVKMYNLQLRLLLLVALCYL